MNRAKTILILSSFIFLFVLQLSAQEYSKKDGVLIHLSSKDPHRVVMSLSMALRMSEDKDVFVFADIDGIYSMLKDSESITYKNFEPSKILIDKLLKAGVKIAVCPMCLEAAGHTKYDLISGLETAQKEYFFNFTEGRILTLDY